MGKQTDCSGWNISNDATFYSNFYNADSTSFNGVIFSRYQEKLRVHALRVMAVVEKTMHRIDNEDKAAKVGIRILTGSNACRYFCEAQNSSL